MRFVCSVFAFAMLLPIQSIEGSSSGLNNIPTADTAGNLQLVFQEYSTFGVKQAGTLGAQQDQSDVVAFKYGIDPWAYGTWRNRLEFGVDSYYGPGDPGPGVFQFKYTTQPSPMLPAICVGVANLGLTSNQRLMAGGPLNYLVLTQNFGFLRLSGGYALQTGHNNTALLGIDTTVKLKKHPVMLRADTIQIDRQKNWAPSFGGISPVGNHFAIEAWVTQPVSGHPASFTVKLDLIFHL